MSAVAEEGWGLTKRLREAERAAKTFAQVRVRVRVRARVRVGVRVSALPRPSRRSRR